MQPGWGDRHTAHLSFPQQEKYCATEMLQPTAFQGTLVHTTRAVLSNWVTQTPGQELLERHHLPSLVNNNMSHYFEVLRFVHDTNRTLQKIPPHKEIYIFEQRLSKCLCDVIDTKQFLSPNLSVSKKCNFLLLDLTSRKYTKYTNTQKERGWPSYDPVSPILLLRD